MIDDRTIRDYPLPHPENIAKHDVVRLREAFIAVDADMNRFDAICTKLNSAFDREKFEGFIGMRSRK
jgi:hypothetical protein